MPETLIFDPVEFVQKTNHCGGSPFVRGFAGSDSKADISTFFMVLSNLISMAKLDGHPIVGFSIHKNGIINHLF